MKKRRKSAELVDITEESVENVTKATKKEYSQPIDNKEVKQEIKMRPHW